ncbi:MAG: 2-dehydropantoate 2-reductase [Vibrionaceae bacterium]|nr:2-dehydropantoate 2-reductase [Vibrionaceae bacterium]
MNIVVLGPGAIGSLWALSLHNAGHSVSLWSRHNQHQSTLQLGTSPLVRFANNDTATLQNADLLLVTLKAPQVETAIQPLLEQIDPDCIVILMHNGMGTADIVAELLPSNPLVLATTTHGAYRPEPNKVQHTGVGVTQLGGHNEKGKQCQFLAEVFDHALSAAQWHNHIEQALWSKLAINCAINPLTAIHQITNGELAADSYHSTLIGVVEEVAQVMNAEGIVTDAVKLEETVFNVIHATAKNHSSMQQDIVHQRPSEINFITGYLLKRAQTHHIAVPYNTALFEQIKLIEQSWKSS